MLKANTISIATATIFFMIWFLNKATFLLQCCKYTHSFKISSYFKMATKNKYPPINFDKLTKSYTN